MTNTRQSRIRKVSGTERAISIILLGFLAAIAFGVVWKGTRPNPPSILDRVIEEARSPWYPRSSPEHYEADNLYAKINGRDTLFHAYDVVALDYVSFGSREAPEASVDIYLYSMSTPLDAFGIFSRERPAGMEPFEKGEFGYRTEGSLYLVQGRHYAQILFYEPEAMDFAIRIADVLAGHLAPGNLELPAKNWFPDRNAVPDSLRYEKQNALGMRFLDDLYTRAYRLNGEDLTAFIKRCNTPSDAENLARRYRDANLDEYSTLIPSPEDAFTIIDYDGWYDLFFTSGSVFAGVYAAENLDGARTLARELREGLIR